MRRLRHIVNNTVLGDAMADLPIGQQTSQVYVVSPERLIILHCQCPHTRVLGQAVI